MENTIRESEGIMGQRRASRTRCPSDILEGQKVYNNINATEDTTSKDQRTTTNYRGAMTSVGFQMQSSKLSISQRSTNKANSAQKNEED